MSELADRVLLNRSWITRRVRQLEGAGLLVRTVAPDDQRGIIASLTRSGLHTFRRMERSHEASINRHFGTHAVKRTYSPSSRPILRGASRRPGRYRKSCSYRCRGPRGLGPY